MGGGNYSRDVEPTQTYTRESVFNYSSEMAKAARVSERREVHASLNIKNQCRECRNSEDKEDDVLPIVVVMDVTKSRGDDALVIFEKVPLLMGQLPMTGIAPHPVISWGAVGDATCGDHAPIQVGQFEADERLDEALSNVWIEEGGGGTGQESYELMAYYYARKTNMDITNKGEKGILFFLGDEGFYEKVCKDQVKVWIGDEIDEDVPSSVIFQELQEKFHVFFVYPKKSWEERKDAIDNEIAGRVRNAGGMVEGCSIRASLLWNNKNDLDLHVICPSGQEIYYSHKNSSCGGTLDVDRNVHGETMKPVENVRWKKGQAPKGHYKVFVQNYGTHGNFPCATPWRAEIEIDGKVQHFEGTTTERSTGHNSDMTIFEFDYDPINGLIENGDDPYALYKDEIIEAQWENVLESGHVLKIDNPKACVDAMIGAIALKTGKKNLDEYLDDMRGRGQDEKRCDDVRNALSGLSSAEHIVEVNPEVFS